LIAVEYSPARNRLSFNRSLITAFENFSMLGGAVAGAAREREGGGDGGSEGSSGEARSGEGGTGSRPPGGDRRMSESGFKLSQLQWHVIYLEWGRFPNFRSCTFLSSHYSILFNRSIFFRTLFDHYFQYIKHRLINNYYKSNWGGSAKRVVPQNLPQVLFQQLEILSLFLQREKMSLLYNGEAAARTREIAAREAGLHRVRAEQFPSKGKN
jgi:hypothetical protein